MWQGTVPDRANRKNNSAEDMKVVNLHYSEDLGEFNPESICIHLLFTISLPLDVSIFIIFFFHDDI